MQWWNDLNDWTSSDAGWRVLSGAIIPFVAIVVAGIVAALIGRAATKRVVALQEREAKNAAVAGLVSAARKAANWGSLGHDERSYADHLAEDADIRLRLLPVAGAPIAANWAQHEIADIKKNSSTFSFQAEQSLSEFRDRILEWQARPARARKLFKSDLERWKFDSPDPDAEPHQAPAGLERGQGRLVPQPRTGAHPDHDVAPPCAADGRAHRGHQRSGHSGRRSRFRGRRPHAGLPGHERRTGRSPRRSLVRLGRHRADLGQYGADLGQRDAAVLRR